MIIAEIRQLIGTFNHRITDFITFKPPLFALAADDETLIVIATFHETGATKTEPRWRQVHGLTA